MLRPHSIGGYEIRRELGRGGTGVVYEAEDPADGSNVALKTIELAVAEQLYRLKHEFRALADVQHPNLVRFGELARAEDGRWFFTMELVNGTDFISYVRGGAQDDVGTRSDSRIRASSSPTMDVSDARARDHETADHDLAPGLIEGGTPATRVCEQRLRDALAQVVSALSAIHDAGHVHRDVKPSNVLVTWGGRVVVLDFGLVVVASPTSDVESWMVGTPAFMAPEQVEGLGIGPAADWYALGVMLYLALTGVLPFGGTISEMMRDKLTREPVPPRELIPGLSPELCALALDLLRLSPESRPARDEIRERLDCARARAPASPRGLGPLRAPFVGRSEELRTLGRALDGVVSNRKAHRILLEGEPGIGKSSLVTRFLRTMTGRALVLSGRCYEQEDVPFKGIDGIVDALSEHLLGLPDEETDGLIGGGVRYLTALFPVLIRVPCVEAASTSARAVGNPSAIREEAFREFEELIGALARTSTVILFVDDLQWADRDSLALFRRVAGERCPVLFVATLRNGTELGAHIAAFAAEAERITVGGLSSAESRALLDALWELRAPGALPSKDALIREAEGHPLFLTELVRSTGEGGSGGRTVALEEVLWERIRARDEVDRSFLEMVAVAGAPVEYGVIAAAARIAHAEASTRLGSLRAAQLVRVSRRGGERTVEPYHDRIRESITRHLRAERGDRTLAAMHGDLARALLRATPEAALPENVFTIVSHFNAAREVIGDRTARCEIARLNLIAAREALRATTYDRACGYTRAGLALLGEEGWQGAYEVTRDLHVEHMWAASFAEEGAESPEAERAFREAREHVASERDRTALHIEWISILTMRRQLSRAIDAGRERLAELGHPMPVSITLETLAQQREAIARLQRARSASQLLDLPDIHAEVHEGAIRTLVTLVPAAFFLDALLRAWLHMSVVLLTVEHGLCDAASYSLSGYGTLLRAFFGDHAGGAAFGRAALALNERFPVAKYVARVVFHYGGWHAAWVGPFSDAKEMLRRAYDLAREHGDTTHETYSATVLAVLTFCESERLATVEETAAWTAEVGLRRKEFDMAGASEVIARYAAALRGESGCATNLGREGSSDDDLRQRFSGKTPTALFYYLFCNAELAYLAGDAARADALLREASKGLQVIFGLPTTLELCFLECLVAAKLHESASAEERERLAGEIEKRVGQLAGWASFCPSNFEPHYLLAAAELARARGAGEEVTAAYERACAIARGRNSSKREALALERAAAYARANGNNAGAAALDGEAARAYRQWGAVTKADALAASARS